MAYKGDCKILEQHRLKRAKLLAKSVHTAEVARQLGVTRQTLAVWQRV